MLPVGSEPVFTIRHVPGKWEIWDDKTMVGFYPESLWKTAPEPFTKIALTQWFGEVAASPTTTRPCSQMGAGRFPSASAAAGEISGMRLLGGPRVSYWTLATHPAFYQAERVPNTTYADTMRFGGPGASPCEN